MFRFSENNSFFPLFLARNPSSYITTDVKFVFAHPIIVMASNMLGDDEEARTVQRTAALIVRSQHNVLEQ